MHQLEAKRQSFEAQQIEQATLAEPRLAFLLERFNRTMESQRRGDVATLASLLRMLRNPRTADAEQFVELMREVARKELDSKRS
jgi:hypothetical protein